MNQKVVLGIDVGGTKTECLILQLCDSKEQSIESDHKEIISYKNQNFKVLARERIKTLKEEGYQSFLDRLHTFILELLKNFDLKLSQVCSLGVGVPGPVCPKTHVMLNGGTQMLIGRDFKLDLMSLFPAVGISIENDANCFALAEGLIGAGEIYCNEKGLDINQFTSIGLILGTGCGGGLVLRGQLYSGVNGASMEVGHTRLFPESELQCYCSQYGCAELFVSGTAIEKHYERLTGLKKPAFDVLDKAETEVRNRVVTDFREHLLILLTNLSNTLNPHIIILGGGLSKQVDLYDGLQLMLDENVYTPRSAPTLCFAQLGDSAGVFGAALNSIP